MDIKFAFAVNNNNKFQKNHFGDSEKFLIFRLQSGSLKLISEIKNSSLDIDEKHGSQKKGEAIIVALKNEGVNVLVSMQFGKNISIINKYFIPVIIYSEEVEEVISALIRQLFWIMDELENTSSDYKLFSIKSGVLKTVIKK